MSEHATFEDYEEMLADRPEKFGAEEADYEEASGPERCARCIHFFESRVQPRAVCEVVRPDGDKDIEPGYRCQFFTENGEDYPLMGRESEASTDDEGADV